ncbi:MAG: YqiJ family protein [Pseudomonadota bacterium]
MEFYSSAVAPFSIALIIVGLIMALEVISTLFGAAFSSLIDGLLPDFDFDADLDGGEIDGAGDGFFPGLMAWLCVGKAPILLLLAAFLLGFGITGILIQNGAAGLFGFFPPVIITSVVAFFAALPMTRAVGLTLARIMPNVDSDAVSSASFVGRPAEIIRGTAKRGAPAEAKLTDANGTTQYVLIEPDEENAAFSQGEEVLLVGQEGAVFRAIRNTHISLTNED